MRNPQSMVGADGVAGLKKYDVGVHWFEVTNGEWGPDDYDSFGDYIPIIMDILKWGGLALMVLALVVCLIAGKIEVPENRRDYFIEGETKFEGVEHPADE